MFEGISSTESFYEHYEEEGKRIGALFTIELLKEDFLRIDFSVVRAAFWVGAFGDRVSREVEEQICGTASIWVCELLDGDKCCGKTFKTYKALEASAVGEAAPSISSNKIVHMFQFLSDLQK